VAVCAVRAPCLLCISLLHQKKIALALLGSTGSHEYPRVADDLKVPQVRPMLCHVEQGGTPAGHILPGRGCRSGVPAPCLGAGSGEVLGHLSFMHSRCVNQVRALSLHLSYPLGGYTGTELSRGCRPSALACGARAVAWGLGRGSGLDSA
jgi:hypothetical protein